MRSKIYLIILLMLGMIISLPAQITITSEDVPSIGDMLEYAVDTFPMGIAPGPEGENQSWDFTQLTSDLSFSSTFVDPSEAPDSDLFPNANLAVRSDTIYAYSQLNSEGLFNLGSAINIPIAESPLVVRFDPPQAALRFPFTFGTNYQDTYSFTISLPADSIDLDAPIEFDSIRVRHTEVVQVSGDAYGQITTDFNTFDVVRMYSVSESFDTVEVQAGGIWAPLTTLQSMSEDYSWIAGGGFGPVFSLSLDEEGTITDAQWLSNRQTGGTGTAPVAQFSFTDQGGGTVDFTDQSTNSPTSWLWDFDDGNTSEEQNPTHTFASSGSYEVCLTASNNAGENTSCQTIEVMLTSIRELRAAYGFRLFPNPANEQVNITMENLPAGQELFILVRGLLGQHIYSGNLSSKLTINTTNWPAGAYPYFVRSEKGELLGSGWLQLNR